MSPNNCVPYLPGLYTRQGRGGYAKVSFRGNDGWAIPASPSLNSYDSSTSGVVHEDRGAYADRV